MQKHSTDHIAHMAWSTLRQQWKEFILYPVLIGVAFLAPVLIPSFMDPSVMVYGPEPALLWTWIIVSTVLSVFSMVYFNAMSKWCEELHKGKALNLRGGLRYGLSRFWGVFWTAIVTFVKIILWMILLILPGLYKAVQYSKSIYVSQLEGVSGGDATRLSQKAVMGSGFLRTMGNYFAIYTIIIIVVEILWMLSILFGGLIFGVESEWGVYLLGVPIFVLFVAGMSFFNTFLVYEYLVFRDENKKVLNQMKKQLAKM